MFVLALIALTPSIIEGQTPEPDAANTFTDLSARLPVRSLVIVTDRQGRQMRGELTVIEGDTLSVKTADRPLTFNQSDVQQIQRQIPDSFLNGAFIGLAIGAAGPMIVCTSIGDSSETVGCVASSLGFGGLSGFAIGAILDRLHTRKMTVFQSKDSGPRTMTISPVIGGRTIGLQMSMRLGR
ncbi:MAG: hypothetical protein ABIS29_14565 [Vicinamibacterales bacterium]